MKKTMKLIAGLAVLLIFGSAYVDGNRDTMVGKQAPALTVDGAQALPSLSEMQGKYVILSFWTPADAMSRLSLKQMAMAVEGMSAAEKGQVGFLSVCLDANENLYREVSRRDNSSEATQWRVDPVNAADLIEAYRLDDEMKTLIIGPDGKIVAVNPEPNDLLELIG